MFNTLKKNRREDDLLAKDTRTSLNNQENPGDGQTSWRMKKNQKARSAGRDVVGRDHKGL
jgi:hypothetical protein